MDPGLAPQRTNPILIMKFQKKDGQSLGRIITQLLAEALASRKTKLKKTSLKWTSRPMKSLVDLSDKENLYRILDERKS